MRSWWERRCTPETPSPCRGAAGKLYLASLPEQELADHLAAPLARPTPYTITSPSALRDEIDECRRTGVAVNYASAVLCGRSSRFRPPLGIRRQTGADGHAVVPPDLDDVRVADRDVRDVLGRDGLLVVRERVGGDAVRRPPMRGPSPQSQCSQSAGRRGISTGRRQPGKGALTVPGSPGSPRRPG
ncbi:hypothetical protein G4H13_15005, partial [Streptomyces rapamycinicus]|nr:hypothetical protein [Streptomyces rhizosphaericus]